MALNLKAIPVGVPLTDEHINYITNRAKELLAAFQARIDSIRAQIETRKAALQTEADDIVADASPENKANARQYSKHAMHSKFAKYRINVVSTSQNQRNELLIPLGKLAEEATFLMTMNQSAHQSLQRVGLGEAKRTNYLQQLESAGPIELESAATLAIVNGDLLLAAAVATVVDRRKKDHRPFSPFEFAERVRGKEHAEVVTKLRSVIQSNTLAQIVDREFRTGEVNMVERVKAGLAQRDIDAAADEGGNSAE